MNSILSNRVKGKSDFFPLKPCASLSGCFVILVIVLHVQGWSIPAIRRLALYITTPHASALHSRSLVYPSSVHSISPRHPVQYGGRKGKKAGLRGTSPTQSHDWTDPIACTASSSSRRRPPLHSRLPWYRWTKPPQVCLCPSTSLDPHVGIGGALLRQRRKSENPIVAGREFGVLLIYTMGSADVAHREQSVDISYQDRDDGYNEHMLHNQETGRVENSDSQFCTFVLVRILIFSWLSVSSIRERAATTVLDPTTSCAHCRSA